MAIPHKRILKSFQISVLALAACFATQVLGHHSFAMYDTGESRIFTGVVMQVIPSPAHLQIFFVPLNEARDSIIRGEDGEPLRWGVEMVSAPRAAELGISVNSFPKGTIFSIGLHPLRDGNLSGARGPFGLYKCPASTPPAAGMHCDSVAGATSHGPGELVALEE